VALGMAHFCHNYLEPNHIHGLISASINQLINQSICPNLYFTDGSNDMWQFEKSKANLTVR
jgi:hypothetical protein